MCCLGKSWQKRQLSDIPDTKQHFINQKSDVLKRSTKVYFLKELVHDCFKKIDLFIMCAFQANHGRKDSFFYILDKKEFFLEQKKEVSKLRKNCNFSKGNQSMVFVKKTSFTMGAFWANHATKDSFRIFQIQKIAFQTSKVKV